MRLIGGRRTLRNVLATIAVVCVVGCGSNKANVSTAGRAIPSWAGLDPNASGTAEQKLGVLVNRLEDFLRGSIASVQSRAIVSFTDPVGRMACGSTDSSEGRHVVVSGISDAQIRALYDGLLALWTQLGYPPHLAQQNTPGGGAGFIVVNNFHIEDATDPGRPLFVEGSTPCVPNDPGAGP